MLEKKLRKVARRLRFLEGLTAAVTFLFYGLVAATAIVVVHKLVDLGALYGLAVAVAVLATIPAGIAAAVLARRDLFDAAMAADERLGLKDRTASAVAVSPEGYAMAELLQEDAERAADLIDPVHHFPFRPPRQGRWIPVPLATMLVLAAFCPEFDLFGRREEKKRKEDVAEAIERQADDLKERTRKVRERRKARKSKREDKLLREIEHAAEQLKRTREKRGAMMKLSEAAKKLKEEQKKLEDIRKVSSKMKALGAKGSEGGSDEMKDFAKKMGEGDFKGAADALRKLKKKLKEMAEKGEISKEEMEAMQRQLERLSDAAREMEPLSRSLDSLAENLPDLGDLGDYAGLEFEDAINELDGLENMTPEELQRLAELARQGQLQLMQMKLQLSKAGKRCPQCGKASCPKCGRPRCDCSGQPKCPGHAGGG